MGRGTDLPVDYVPEQTLILVEKGETNMRYKGLLAVVLSAAMISTAVIAAESQSEKNETTGAQTESEEMVQTQADDLDQTEADGLTQTEAEGTSQTMAEEDGSAVDTSSDIYTWRPGMAVRMPDVGGLRPWMLMQAAMEKMEKDQKLALAEIRSDSRAAKAKAVADALESAQSEMEQILSEAAAAAQSEKEQALSEAAESAQSEKEQALSEAAAAAQSEKEQALSEAAASAQSEKEQALSEAAEMAKSEKEQALSEAAETAKSEKEQALSEAAETAQSEKEQALSEAEEAARADKEQALTDAREQWESEQQAQDEAEQEALYNSNVWTKSETMIRESADPESKVFVIAPAGSPMGVIAKQDGAFLVDYYGLRGYVDSDSIEIPEAMEENVETAPGLQAWCKVQLEQAASHLNVREGAGTDFPIIGQLGSEEIVYLTGNRSEDGAWAEIVYDNGGSTGWSSTKYLVERTEGEPEEYTRLMYYAEYAKIADLLRNKSAEGDLPMAWQNGSEADPLTVMGNATIISGNQVYTGAVLCGEKKGQGTMVEVSEDDPDGYVRITGTWDGDSVSGTTVWSYCSVSDPTKDVTITGTIVDGVWEKDITVRAADENGQMKYYYGYADHGNMKIYGEKDGKAAIAKSADGALFYVYPDSVFGGAE